MNPEIKIEDYLHNKNKERNCTWNGCVHNDGGICCIEDFRFYWDLLESISEESKTFICTYAKPKREYCLCGWKLLVEKENNEAYGSKCTEYILSCPYC